MKHKRKYVSILLALLFTISMQIPAIATTTHQEMDFVSVQPFWQNVNRANATLTISGTTANCRATITGLAGTTRITATMHLQRIIGNSVVTVRTWTQTANSGSLVMSESATVTANGNYHLRVDATVVRNGVTETISISG
ncbi:MAG: hypothetical protein FWF81_11090 [Defluviitaleaceae bacterium]|nr:hypothetical protein [Defluviitaleaceae bacterium]